MRHIISILTISMFLISCGQNDTKQKELELKEREIALKEKELALKEKDTITSMADTKEPDIIQNKNAAESKLTTTSNASTVINTNEFLGKWVRWNKGNNCNDITELKKTNTGLFSGDFYPECFEDAGFIQNGKLSEDKIIFSKDEGFQGTILTLEKGKLVETNLNGKGKTSYTKLK